MVIPVSVRVLDPVTDLAPALEVVAAAFAPQAPQGSQPVEVGLTRALVVGGHVPGPLGLVAVGDGAVVGVVLGSIGQVGGTDAIGLGPLAVSPSRQSTGVGSALVDAVLAAADAAGFPLAALLGDPGFYARFGFVTAAELGVESPDPAWGGHFQARRLSAWTVDARGPFRYAAPFDDL
ncbi:GNAT family N-acetyltransferase [uncultured Williamsia sp.]|uniref:GNAT family N-acetyltransferase n=1 Tax=uncultured Williamsia sp. TaxID=259311 RepID=UPI00261BC380|nr:GNAT family N-acetyltransferase [uncultured Williamsia sp.]